MGGTVGSPAPIPGGPLAAAYRCCRLLHRTYGRTYYLATRLLPAWKRRHVYALYGFTRYTDEIVDRMGDTDPADRARRLADWGDRFLAGLAGPAAGCAGDPVLPAVLHTIRVFDLDPADFRLFLRSMAMDLTVTRYPTYAELLSYMEGSSAVIGTMMLPILADRDDRAAARTGPAREAARQLGFAFQLTNFIRDVAEDLDRGRIYLPAEDLDRFRVTPADLAAPVAGPAVRRLIGYEMTRARRHYRAAEPGIALLPASSRPCIRAAFTLYGGILDEVAAAGYDVLSRRATVPNRRRARVAARELGRLLAAGGR